MKKPLLILFLALLFGTPAFAATGDTTVIVAHTHTNLASPPTDYDIWTVFPNTSVTYQKVIMKFTLGCGTPNCSGWDYTVNSELGKKNGTLDSSIAAIDTVIVGTDTTYDTTWTYRDHVNFIEIGRLITPYGTYMANNSNGFNNAWTQPYYYDVTDYAGFLKDSVDVRVHYDGWTDAFSANVEFIFIEGPPGRDIDSVRQLYHGGYGYGSSSGFESQVGPQTFFINSSVSSAKVVVDMTGHGSQGEFDPRNFHILVNGTDIYDRLLWKDDCGMNAVYPQGGTWIFNRANWCPGSSVPIYEVDITPYITPGQNVTVDLDMDDFTIQSGQSSTYILSAHLITYTSQKNNDVMMEEIIAPNSDKTYLRYNPICTNPKVKIKNTGKSQLTYAEISYWVKGGVKWYYIWNGNLSPFQSEIITLPAFDWNGLDTTDRVFIAEANWPNNVPDEYTYNNHLESAFNMVPQTDSVWYIFYKSNNAPWEDQYVIKDENGDTIDYKNSANANTIYRDTLHLIPGSYAFDFFDFDSINWGGGDGLSWWFNQMRNTDSWYETAGQLNLRKKNGVVYNNINPDFGNNVHYEFTVGYPLGYNDPKNPPPPPIHPSGIIEATVLTADLNVFPNPAMDILNVHLNLSKEASGNITLTDITGRLIRQYSFNNSSYQNITVPVKELARGMYFVNLLADGVNVSRKIILQ
ncbi:MAG: hypothetical protein JWO06_134 [Bacteroidota bacterium]|nr:hypothetical protein [Bacteroidota bacterium]